MATEPARPKSAQKQPIPAEAPTHSPLTPFQEQVCDLAGDLILHGGHQDDIADFLAACMSHEWRRRGFDPDNPEKQQRDVDGYVSRWLARWVRKLSRNWQDDPTPGSEPAAVEPEIEQSVSERIRSTVRDEIKERFETFLGDANPEDMRLLRDIFMSAESFRGDNDDVPLALAFSYEIGRHTEYIRVSYKQEKLVRQYIELLEKGEDHRAAA